MIFKSVINKIGTKTWTDEQVEKYVGSYRTTHLTYAQDKVIRQEAASGGSVSALLIQELEAGHIDGALVLRTAVKEGRVENEFFIAKTREDILCARGSKYMAVFFNRDAMPLIRNFEGRLGVVALPCDATLLKRFREKDESINRKIAFVITLVCGHNTERELTDAITAKIGHKREKLTHFRYRFGHWRGKLRASFSDGTEVVKPFRFYSDYQNLYFFCQRKCHHCHDHFGYDCDISAGDVWSLYLRDNPIKHTALIIRSEIGETILTHAQKENTLHTEDLDVREIMNGQSRTMPFHYQ